MIHLQRDAAEHLAWAVVQLLALCVVAATVGLALLGWGVGIACVVATHVLVRRAMRRHAAPALGPADRITLVRASLTAVLAALVVGGAEPGIVVVLGTLALLSDFLDGQVARRTGTVSVFGARLDMEVDAFLILVLSAHVATACGAWVLAIGAMRYAFVVASWWWPRLRGDVPPSFARKTVAALQGIVLVTAASGVVPHAGVLVLLALLALVWSFGRDLLWLSSSRT
ncbi:CDP-alcohol phosphatidyltransferase family protein [Saccharopolyspora rhizosphaerae]|uniref:CDP-alcohol phosphatidyltransferase family protein n=1 Tax=Saccharopolyspora rhizosphaerae TaxID=2492662 RepID=A0A3R8P4X7_9PSEU|nr:CDP-alcohol phosphatidyltransferase family protein [Saccharopolyspora rhizosphaerae]RRO16668.1 CDP-alcohol phosphatidyltransferase family protein [Saccharopolyspora rhizosphaerae]